MSYIISEEIMASSQTEKISNTVNLGSKAIICSIIRYLILFVVLFIFASSCNAAEQKTWNAYQTPFSSGSYNFGYKIDLPSGTHGITPSLTMSYNSYLAKNIAGWVGVGWDIPCSYIQTNTDGTFDFFLNGAKHDLVDLTAVNGRYHTKIETYLKIQKKTGAANERGAYWTAYDTSGTEYRFGYNPDSENMINAAGTPYVWRWSLDRVKDANGNCVYFTYAENPAANDLGAVYLSRIEYNNDKKRLVEFILEETDRPDMTAIVDQGSTVQEARRLAEIRVSVDGQLVKKLVFQYALNEAADASLLSSITKYGSDGTTALPPESFEYTAFVDGLGINTDLLTKVTSMLGGVTTIGYSPSSTAINTALPENYWLVTSIAQANGMTGAHAFSATSTIAYENGAYDTASQEFRGFGKVTETRPDGSKAVHLFHQDNALKGRVQSSAIFDATGAPYSGIANVWTSSLTRGVYSIHLQQTERYTYDGVLANPKTTKTEYGNFDAYGNAKREVDHGDLAVTGDETATIKEFVYNPDLWIVNRVKHSTITAGVGGRKLRENWFYYDRSFSIDSVPFAGNLTKEAHWNNGGENPVIQYKYDDYGNLIRKTDPLGSNSEIIYDTTYQTFPEFVYNAKGHVTTTAFNPVIGKPVMVTDPNGNTTTYVYDVFHRLAKIVKPGDSIDYPTTEMHYVINSTPPHLVIVKTRETAGGLTFDTVQSIDGLGKTLQTKSESDSAANMAVSDTYYDFMGREAKHSNAYLTADTALTYSTPDTNVVSTGTEYDVLGRATKITHPDSTFTTNSYFHWTLTQTDENGVAKSKTYDADNNLVGVVENNKGEVYTTAYQYSLMAELLTVRDHLGNTSTHEYDTLGRKTKTVDVDFGQKLFGYDLAGNLISQTDARGITIKYQFDALNRQTLIDYPNDKDIQFVYDLDTKGTLSRVYNNLGMDSYKYDSRLRKSQETRTMDGQTWTTSYAYDTMDRLVSQTYPDGEVIQYSYNSRDKLAAIQRGSQTLQNGMTYNAAGQLTQKTYGNGWITMFTHDPANLRLTNISTTKSPAALQNLAYTYDQVGNVKTLSDASAGRTETFTYDDLYRMVRASDNLATGGFDRSYVYNAVGNMTLETDNKTATEIRYSYGQGTAKPHAVTGKTSTDGLPIVGSLVINKGQAYCTNPQVTLDNISMGVAPGAVTDFYLASEDKDFTGATWLPFSTAPVLLLTGLPTGFKMSKDIIIYFKVKNSKGESKVKSATIQWLSDIDSDGQSDLNDADNDNDGIPDTWETEHGLNSFDPSDAAKHPPGDELTYLEKYLYGLNPNTPDSDGDGWSDNYEIKISKTNPNLADTDRDGIPDPTDSSPNNPYNEGFSENYSVKRWAFNAGSGKRTSVHYITADVVGNGFSESPLADTDGDGMPDAWEVAHGLDPANPNDSVGDADGDGLTNLQEYLYRTNPTAKDTDGDGWSDYQELFVQGTNPNAKDSDQDGIPDPQDPEPQKPTFVYSMSENYTIRKGGFSAGGSNRTGTAYAFAPDKIGGLSAGSAVYYATFSSTPEEVIFANTEVNQSRTQVLTLSNKGNDNLVIGAITLTGLDVTDFTLTQENCSGEILSPSVSCEIQIAFRPQSPGAKGTVAAIQYNDGELKNAAVAVSGIAEAAAQKKLKILRMGSGVGAITSNPAGISCGGNCETGFVGGTSVTLTALSNSGSTFNGWTGGGCAGTENCTLVMETDVTVSGIFLSNTIDFNTWKKKNNFTGTERAYAVGFTIGSKGYVATGGHYSGTWTLHNDLWEYDAATNIWTQKAYFGGTERSNGVGFSIGTTGFVGTGIDSAAHKNDFWAYDASTGTWAQKADFGGTPREGAVGFSIGSKGYIGTGNDGSYKQDIWEYDPGTNIWTPKANFAGTARWGSVGFSIGKKGYVGTGHDASSSYSKDFWEYDPSADIWTQRADFGGTERGGAVGFSIGRRGYIGTGYDALSGYTKDFWEYNPAINTWSRKADFPGTARYGAVGFAIDSKAYVGTGYDGSCQQDFWEYKPGNLAAVKSDINGDGISDILLKNTATHQVALWFINANGTVLGSRTLFTDPNSTIVEMGDFNNDGIYDLIKRNTATGQTVLWFMNANGTRAGYKVLWTAVTSIIVGTGDFNADGICDLIKRDLVTGQSVLWFMNAEGTRASYKVLFTDVNSTVAGTGDFDGDGICDLIKRNSVTGQAVLWFMNADGTRASYKIILSMATWTVAGTADVNGDGITDIIWRNTSTNQYNLWLMSADGTHASPVTLLALANWTLAGTGDINGDGLTDLIWQSTSGLTRIWFMRADGSHETPVTLFSDVNWTIVPEALQ